MYDVIGKKWWFFIFSGLIIIPGIISLLSWGVRLGIDFTGGTLIELKTQSREEVKTEDLKNVITSQNLELVSVQTTGEQTFLLRLKPINKEQNQKLMDSMENKFGSVEEVRSETVGPTIGQETTKNAFRGVIAASVAIIIYIAYSFRKIPKPYSSVKFGVSAVVALIHDVLVVVGIFSIFGHFFKVELDSLFITALLTIMGFSVHDSIVVFDRIRENLIKMPGSSFSLVVNESLVQTLARSLSTSLTVLLMLFALLLFGGESIRWFILTLLIGITSGTYSSIFNAAPLLVLWEEYSQKKKKV